MQPYHLAKLIQWSPGGELKSRKRMQKVIFLLQAAGCAEFDAEYTLHHYGPYSQDVAALTDQMVAAGLLVESAAPNQMVGSSYCYRLSESASNSLVEFETQESGKQMAAEMEPFQTRAEELVKTEVKELEFAATVAYFYRQTKDWGAASTKTCEFKKLEAGGAAIKAAVKLAERFVG